MTGFSNSNDQNSMCTYYINHDDNGYHSQVTKYNMNSTPSLGDNHWLWVNAIQGTIRLQCWEKAATW